MEDVLSPVGGLRIVDANSGATITYKKDIDFAATGEYEIWQCVKYILITSIRSVTLDREFAMDFVMVDKPKPIAKLMLTQEIAMKISLFERRCEFVDISYRGEDSVDGELQPEVKIALVVTT